MAPLAQQSLKWPECGPSIRKRLSSGTSDGEVTVANIRHPLAYQGPRGGAVHNARHGVGCACVLGAEDAVVGVLSFSPLCPA